MRRGLDNLSNIILVSLFAISSIAGCGGGSSGSADGGQSGNPTYALTYSGNGSTAGSVPTDSASYEQGQSVTVLGNTGNLTRTGYAFAGWNTQSDGDGDGATYTQGQTFTIGSGNVTLYAEWSTSTLPDTGQTSCYDSAGNSISCTGSGHDGAYSINPPSYSDNGDETITDNVTGLTWQKCTIGLGGSGCTTGAATAYNWYQASGTYDVTYNAATTDVCGASALAGGGWRIPTAYELMTILNYETYFPAVDAAYFPATQFSYYWSSVAGPGGTTGAWIVGFADGTLSNLSASKSSTYDVRCVR